MQNGTSVALELIYGTHVRRDLHLFCEPDPFKGVLGQLCPKLTQINKQNKIKMIMFPGGLSATKYHVSGMRVRKRFRPARRFRPALFQDEPSLQKTTCTRFTGIQLNLWGHDHCCF